MSPSIESPSDLNHALLSWTGCVDRTCQMHLGEKRNANYFPTKRSRERQIERLEEERKQSEAARDKPVKIFDGPRRRKNQKQDEGKRVKKEEDPMKSESWNDGPGGWSSDRTSTVTRGSFSPPVIEGEVC